MFEDIFGIITITTLLISTIGFGLILFAPLLWLNLTLFYKIFKLETSKNNFFVFNLIWMCICYGTFFIIAIIPKCTPPDFNTGLLILAITTIGLFIISFYYLKNIKKAIIISICNLIFIWILNTLIIILFLFGIYINFLILTIITIILGYLFYKFLLKNEIKKINFIAIFITLILSLIFISSLLTMSTICLPKGDPIIDIGNIISSNNGTILETKTFEIEPKQTISSDSFANEGIDPCALMFSSKSFDNSQLETIFINKPSENVTCISNITNKTNSTIRARATIICEQGRYALNEFLIESGLDESLDDDTNLEDFLNNQPDEYTKMCIVFLKRP